MSFVAFFSLEAFQRHTEVQKNQMYQYHESCYGIMEVQKDG